ncbi:hypothetical protein EV207_108146 [Scopulibacillus darangshiensis]|uniref:Uncharacterized protein n=1 Tax=Scopulibacillus darangshiensis TaxID=442528 RepID=A0A4R2P510_9BACL|nr:hypothetical protein EV207_108146 [Scopulibacillus darangshiensis]
MISAIDAEVPKEDAVDTQKDAKWTQSSPLFEKGNSGNKF